MANPSYPGRMINQGVSQSEALARLTRRSSDAGFLYFLIVPHLNSHGKLCGDPNAIKGLVCPLIRRFTTRKISKLLREISETTNLKWWRDEKGLFWVHAIRFHEEQNLREDRLGKDHLPSWPEIAPKSEVQKDSGSSPGVVPLEVEVKEKGSRRSLPAGEEDAEASAPQMETGEGNTPLAGTQAGVMGEGATQGAQKKSRQAKPRETKPREPNPIWDTICDLFSLKPVDPTEERRIGKVVATLKKKSATPEKIRAVYAKMDGSLAWAPFSPEGLVKWYDQLSAAPANGHAAPAPVFAPGFR